jgi:regulatory protein
VGGPHSGGADDPGSEQAVTSDAPGPPDRVQDALDRCYRYLAHRDRTELEIRGHLERAGIEAGAVDDAVRILTELDYLDDARFAARFAQDKRELEAWGAERIERRLIALGVDREHIRPALADPEAGTELERARALLHRRFPAPLSDRRSRDRALGVLLRKGYEPDLALEALSAHARDEGEIRPRV